MIAEVKKSSCFACLIVGGAWVKCMRGQTLIRLLELEHGQVVICNEIRCHQIT